MVRSRPPVRVECGWDDQTWDVTDDVESLRISHGVSYAGQSRTVVWVARGQLTLTGGRWQPGHADAIASDAALRATVGCRVLIGTTAIWEGSVSSPVESPRAAVPETTYSLRGHLRPLEDERVTLDRVGQAWPTTIEWGLIGLEEAPELLGVTTSAIRWAPIAYEGPPLRLVSLMAGIDGRLVGEDCHGRLVAPTYARWPDPLTDPTVIDTTLQVAAVETHVLDDRIRNVVELPFYSSTENPSQSQDGVAVQLPIATSAAPPASTYRIAVALPDLEEGETRSNYRARILSAVAVVGSDSVSGAGEIDLDVSGHMSVTVTPPAEDGTVLVATVASSLATSTLTWTQTRTTYTTRRVWIPGSTFTRRWSVPPGGSCPAGSREISATVTSSVDDAGNVSHHVTARCQSGRYQTQTTGTRTTTTRRSITDPVMVQDGAGSQPTRIKQIEVRVRMTWDSTSDTSSTRRITVPASVTARGARPVEWPTWVADHGLGADGTARAQILADLTAAAEPRVVHVVRLPLWQATDQQVLTVAGVDIGDGCYLDALDRTRGVDVSDECVAVLRTITAGQGRTPYVELQLLRIRSRVRPSPPPPAPTRLRMTARTWDAISVAWDAPPPTSTTLPDGYQVQWGTGGSYADGDRTVTDPRITLTGLTADTVHDVRVRSVSTAHGTSQWLTGQFRSAPPPPPPGPPTNLRRAAATQTTMDVAWDAPASGTVPERYRIQWAVSGTGTILGNQTTMSTSFDLSGLSSDTSYDVRVRSEHSESGNSAYVGAVMSTSAPQAAPGVPPGLAVVAGGTNLDVSWDAPTTGGDVVDYTMRHRAVTSPVSSWSQRTGFTGRSGRITGLSFATLYEVQVRANGQDANSAWSASVQATTALPPAPGVPAGVSAVAGDSEATVSWSAPATGGAVATYELRHKPATGATWTTINDIAGDQLRLIITDLTNGTAYDVSVRSRNAGGVSTWATTSVTPVGAPAGPVITILDQIDAGSVGRWVRTRFRTAVPAGKTINRLDITWGRQNGSTGALTYNRNLPDFTLYLREVSKSATTIRARVRFTGNVYSLWTEYALPAFGSAAPADRQYVPFLLDGTLITTDPALVPLVTEPQQEEDPS